MLRSLKLGTAFGIDLYVHWTFLLLPLWVLFANLGVAGPLVALFFVALSLAVFGCVLLHELGHAMMARRFGIRTLDITLYPIGGVARLDGRMGENPRHEFWVALAGPLVNLAIAGLLWVFLRLSLLLSGVVLLPPVGLTFLFFLMWANLILFGFNLVPAFPMDGGRILRALFSHRLGQLQATRIAVQVGMSIALVMVLAGLGLLGPVLQNPMLIVIAVFVFFAGQQELAMVYQGERWRWQQANSSAEEEPVHAGPSSPSRDVSVYLWDTRLGAWVKQKPLRPIS